jgi:hypothetical protein
MRRFAGIPNFVNSMLPKSKEVRMALWIGFFAILSATLLVPAHPASTRTGVVVIPPPPVMSSGGQEEQAATASGAGLPSTGSSTTTASPFPVASHTAASPVPVAVVSYVGSLLLNATGSQLESWNQTSTYCRNESWEVPDGLVSTDSGNDAVLTVTGKPGSCVGLISPGTYSSVVIEAYVYFPPLPGKPGIIANWTTLWLSGMDWPINGELDAVEVGPTTGLSAVTWHWGTTKSPLAISTSGRAGSGALPIDGPNVTPGWHVVDIIYMKGFFAVYYDGKEYTSLSSNEISGSPLKIFITTSVTPDVITLEKTLGGWPVNSDSSPAGIAVKYVKVWSSR